MLKKLIIKDFESHENTEITFGPGLNVICGHSNHGKSATLRALELAAYGVWAAGEDKKKGVHGPVRIGQSTAEIYAESDKGYVRVKRAKGVNEWELKGEGIDLNLKNPGGGLIPEAQEILGLKSIEIAGDKIRFNWSSQRDKHFLVDEVDGRASSPSFVAAVLDEVGGLSGCEDLVIELAQDKAKADRAMKAAAEEITELEEELKNYEHLDDEITRAAQTKKCLDYIDDQHKIIKRSRELNLSFNDLILELGKYRNLETEIKKTKATESKLKKLDEKLKETLGVNGQIEQLQNTEAKIKKAKEELEKADKIDTSKATEILADVQEKQEQIERIKRALNKLETLTENIKKINIPKINLKSAAKKISTAETKIIELEKQDKHSEGFLNLKNKTEKAKTRFGKSIRSLNRAEKELNNLLEELNFCPFCGQEISEDCKQEIIEEV